MSDPSMGASSSVPAESQTDIPPQAQPSSDVSQLTDSPGTSVDLEQDVAQSSVVSSNESIAQISESTRSEPATEHIVTVTPNLPESIPEPQQIVPSENAHVSTEHGSLVPVLPQDPNRTHWVAISDWLEREHWFKEGDLVEFWRSPLYSHWGIYMGNGLVAHVTSYDLYNGSSHLLRLFQTFSALPSAASKPSFATASMAVGLVLTLGEMTLRPSPPPSEFSKPNQYYYRIDHIALVAGNSQFRVNNLVHRAKSHITRTWEEIFSLVHRRLHTVHTYCVRTNNCEHVATSLRYKRKDGISLKRPLTDA